jgi:tetratricopeptide (TPR) repeat protein
MAKERGQVREAVRLCQSALDAEPRNPAHYLNLGRILLLADDKEKAIATFWRGLSNDPAVEVRVEDSQRRQSHHREHGLILNELRRLGIRKRVPFGSLHRGHPLNRVVGKFLSAIGFR